MKLNLNGWKKVNSEKDHSILQNKDGHQLKVLHKALSKDSRKQLDKLEMCQGSEALPSQENSHGMAKGGDPTQQHILPGDKSSNKIEKQVVGQAKAKMADGGKVPSSTPPPKDKGPTIDPQKAKEMQKGATESGWQPEVWKKNLKEGLGLAKGGMAHYDEGSKDGPVSESDLDSTPSLDQDVTIPVGQLPMTPQAGTLQSDPRTLPQSSSNPDEAAATPEQQPQVDADQPPAGAAPLDPNAPTADNAFNMQASALQGMGKNESEGLKKEADLHQKAAQELQTFQATKQVEDKKAFDEALAQGHDLANEKVDPELYWKDHSKVMAAIGLALSSFGGTGEAAMNFLNNQINRSVDAQKSNIANKKSLLAMNMKIYGDKSAAEDATRAAGAAAIAHQIQSAAAKSGSKEAQLKAQMAVGQLMQQYAPLMQRAATIKTLNSGAADHMDPANFLSIAKPEHQKQIAEDMDAAKETRKSSIAIMKAQERAINDMTSLHVLTPGSVMALHALISPSFKNIDNSVRKGAMDALFDNITPSASDVLSPKRVKEKREALAQWIQTKGGSSLAKSNGIDFDKFDATRPLSREELLGIQRSGGEDTALTAPQVKSLNGVQYQKVSGGWRKVQ